MMSAQHALDENIVHAHPDYLAKVFDAIPSMRAVENPISP
jgi:hypothetical protein